MSPPGTLDASWGTAMTWKDELLMLWIFCSVVISFAARHFFGGAVYLVEQMAALSVASTPAFLHSLLKHLH
jgi:hypothetical protein